MRNIRILLLVLGGIFSLISCKHDNIEDLLGPDLNESGLLCPQDGFEIRPANDLPSSLNFTSDVLTETLLLTEPAKWEYGFIGSNGARFSESGFGDEALVNWSGNTSTSFLFKEGDSVQSYYKVPCLDTIFGERIKIDAPKIYDHFLVSDFEGNGIGTPWVNVAGQLDFTDSVSTGAVPQGDSFIRLVGSFQDRGSFLGQAQVKLKNLFGLSVPADSLYLNALVKGSPNSAFEFRILQVSGDVFTVTFPVTWEGWRLVSVRYSDMLEFNPPRVGANTSFINEVRCVVRYADGDTDPDYTIDLDFMSFSIGKPLEL